MYELAELTDLIHGYEGEDDPALGPTDPESELGCLLIGELVEELREEDSPIGRLRAIVDGLAADGCPVVEGCERAAYYPSADHIIMPAPGAFRTSDAHAEILLHEATLEVHRRIGLGEARHRRRSSARTLAGCGCGIVALAP